MPVLGIRREDKHEWERRVPLTPDAVARLCKDPELDVVVQPSAIRVFADGDYRAAGAAVSEELAGCDMVLAVKEIPTALLRKGGAYAFFSHTVKGQAHNMPLLRRLMELDCTLVDYERIVDAEGCRLVSFGRHAGLAGMIDTLHVLGRRLAWLGYDTPLAQVSPAHQYESLAAAEAQLSGLAAALALPAALCPFVVGFAGYGNVSRGAQEIFDRLRPETVEPEELAALVTRSSPPRDRLFKVVFEERHLVQPDDPAEPFRLQTYYDHPERFRSRFEAHARNLSALVNAIYWTDAYPRLITNRFLCEWFREDPNPRLKVVGDISCDVEGSVQCTTHATTPGRPAYVYEPVSGRVTHGWQGPGLCMMTTDCLPCELPRESSEAFTEALLPYVAELAKVDFACGFDAVRLPEPIRRATILWRGKLTPDYAYMQRFLFTDPGGS